MATNQTRLRGEESPWYGYVQSLPVIPVDIALLWGEDAHICPTSQSPSDSGGDNLDTEHRVDSIDARQWIKGTEVEKQLRSPGGGLLVQPFLSRPLSFFRRCIAEDLYRKRRTITIASQLSLLLTHNSVQGPASKDSSMPTPWYPHAPFS